MTDELSAKRERILLAALNRAVSEWEWAVAHSDLNAKNRKYAEESIEWMRGRFGLVDETGMLMDDGKII